jgi:serine/threonine protein kinase
MKPPNEQRQRFLLAAGTRTSLSHPHLIPARAVRDDRGRVRILLQRQQAPTLSELLASGPVDIRTSLRLLFGVATAVEVLSKAGLVARDLKPDRILVCPRRGGILADPGIPLELLPRESSPDDPDWVYRSPEEQAGLPIDARSNVYSLAAVFEATVTAPDGERLALPAPAKAVIGRAMAIDPARRYASPPEFIVTLASAFGFRQRTDGGEERSAAATREGEASTATERPSVHEAPASTRPVTSPPPLDAQPEPPPVESKSHGTQPRRPADQNGSRPAHEQLVPAPTRPRRTPAEPVRSEATGRPRPEPSAGSAGGETRRVRPRLRVPTLPRLAMPTLPRLRASSLPRLALPALPRLRASSLPRLALPALPRLRASSLPRLALPALPRLRASSLPRLRTPKLPSFRAPAIGRLSAPTLPRLRAPNRMSAAAVAFGLGVVGLFLVGMLLGRDAGEKPQAALLERSSFTVVLPAGWGETKVAQAGGIKLSAPVAAAPLGEGGAGLVVARVPEIVTLDERFRAELAANGRRTEVGLGRLQAWRYAGLPAKRGLVATAYVAPTTGDPLLFICHAPRSDARPRLAECEEIASTVALRGDRPASLAAVTRHEEQVVSVMARLRRERLLGRRHLAGVELASDQARAARDLERTYKEAAARLARGEPPAGTTDLDDLVGTLRLTASAYGELADAAADADKADYRAASEAVLEGEEAVRREAADPKPA